MNPFNRDDSVPRGLYFDSVAHLYDRVRVDYPARLFEDLLAYTGDPPVERALEIGCATGQATLSLARRGIHLTCIEPGARLAELARRNLAGFPHVEVFCTRFEDWQPAGEPFDLVLSANAIHWVNRKVRVRKTAQVLRTGGTLAIFRSFPVKSDSALQRAIDSVPAEISASGEEPQRLPREMDFRNSGYFERFESFRYESRREFDADRYVDFLATLNRYKPLEPEARAKHFKRIHDIIVSHGGRITIRFITRLLLARRRHGRSWVTPLRAMFSQRR